MVSIRPASRSSFHADLPKFLFWPESELKFICEGALLALLPSSFSPEVFMRSWLMGI